MTNERDLNWKKKWWCNSEKHPDEDLVKMYQNRYNRFWENRILTDTPKFCVIDKMDFTLGCRTLHIQNTRQNDGQTSLQKLLS